ncbi:MAG: glycosyltransferase family 39 protein [Anaerolineales bacterium]|nr:glycosyltransferase family 39 protein [Anaerolineales bacterium]
MLFFTLLGFGLRLYHLDFQPLWGDEGWSVYFATENLGQLIALTAADIHPPLYYLLLKGWFGLMGVGPEAARLLSVLIGTLLIPVLLVLGRRLFGARVGVIAAAVAALMPMAIYYAQEVRMYGLVTLLGAASTYFFVRWQPYIEKPSAGRAYLLGYIATTSAALYTMYYAAFIVLFQLLYTLIVYLRPASRRPNRFLALLGPFLLVGLLYLPWVIYAAPRLLDYIDNKRNVEGYTPLGLDRFFGDHVIAFSLGHLPDDLRSYAWAVLVAAGLALLGWVVALLKRNQAALLISLYLFGPLTLGYLINLLYPFTPRFFERTLLLAAPAYWLLVAAGLRWLWARHTLFLGLAASGLLLVTLVSLFSFYNWARYPAEDYRPLLADIAAQTTPQDTVLASYQWQLGLYRAYLPPPRPDLFPVPGWGRDWSAAAGGSARLTADLTAIFKQSPRLWFPAYQASGHIWEDEAEQAIAKLGYPALLEWYSPQTKLTLAGSGQMPMAPAEAVNFGDRLNLVEAEVGNQVFEAGRDVIPIRLVWQKTANLGSEPRVSLRLTDAAGRTWTTRDSFPQAGHAFFTDLDIGELLTDHHGLLTPAGAPPGLYRLLLSVRQGDDAHPLDLLNPAKQPTGAEALLAEVELVEPEPPLAPAALPVQIELKANFGQAARLVGYSLGQPPFKSGQALPLTLFWQSQAEGLEQLSVVVELEDATGQIPVTHDHEPIWPATEWHVGTLLRDPHDISLPPTLPPGDYRLFISLVTGQGEHLMVQGSNRLLLGTIATSDRPHNFDAPAPAEPLSVNFSGQVELVGFDLPETHVAAGGVLPVTLYWHSLATFDKNWKVFVHLIDAAGDIKSQQDQLPGAGQFPTTSWVPDEYITDSYNIPIPADLPPGEAVYRLRIGWYDPNDFNRMLVVVDGRITGDDHIVLESWPISVE